MSETNKLPAEFKIQWLNALKSGEFKKGHGELYTKTDDSYCCLGVAAILLGAKKEALEPYATFTKTNGESMGIEIPEAIKYERNDSNEHCKWHHQKLTQLNDNNDTFEEVITYIEENL